MDKIVLDFIKELKEHNDRDWFQKNERLYRNAKAEFDGFIDALIPRLREFDGTIDLITAKDCTFRIYRDVRFSHDKAPYKTNFGAYIARGGKKSMMAGYYVHAEPGASMLAGGMHLPPPENLRKLRDEIYYNWEEFQAIMSHKEFRKYYDSFDPEYKLLKAPKGYPSDFPGIEWLKFKSLAVWHDVSDPLLSSPDYLDYALEAFHKLLPLNRFFNRSLE